MGKTSSTDTKLTATKKQSSTTTKTKIPPKQQRALNAIAALMEKNGVDSVPRSQVMGMIDCKNLNSINILLSGLKKHHNFIAYPDKESVTLTESGIANANPNDDSFSTDNLAIIQKAMEGIKGKKQRELFQFLSDGSKRSRQECAAKVSEDACMYGLRLASRY